MNIYSSVSVGFRKPMDFAVRVTGLIGNEYGALPLEGPNADPPHGPHRDGGSILRHPRWAQAGWYMSSLLARA